MQSRTLIVTTFLLVAVCSSANDPQLHGCKDVNQAKSLLSKGAGVNARDSEGQTPLHHCVNVAMARFLIENTADVSTTDQEGATPLHYCTHLDVCRLLVKKGAYTKGLGALSKMGRTPLYWAAVYGSYEVVKLLLDKKSDPNQADCDGQTPLHAACFLGSSKVEKIELLLKYGANVMARDGQGRTPLHLATRRLKWPEKSDLLIVKKIIESMLERDFYIDTTDDEGWTALHYAIARCGAICIKLFLDKGANMNAANIEDKTPWYLAVKIPERRDEIVQLMIDQRTDVAVNFFERSTPLLLATRSTADDVRPILRMIDILISRLGAAGFDIDLLDANGKTSLLVAMGEPDHNDDSDHFLDGWRPCSIDHVRVLLARGASIERVYWANRAIIGDFYRRCYKLISLPIGTRLIRGQAEITFNIESHINDLANKLSAAEISFSLGDFVPNVVEEYRTEIEKLKSSVIHGKMSHYEFLHQDDPLIASGIFKSNYDIANLPVEFPAYGNLLKAKLKMDSF